jgi:hypothetical protein
MCVEVGVVRWKLFAALAVVLLVAVVGGSALGSNARPAPIPVPAGVALQAGDLPGFTAEDSLRPEPASAPVVPLHPDQDCFHGFSIDYTPPPQRCAFSGFIVDTALMGAGRAEIDASARADGVPTDTDGLPEIPIHGPFVATHSGIFEIYDDIAVFADETTAEQQFAQLAYPRAGQLVGYRELPSSLGDDRLMYTGGFGPDPASSETQIVTIWRRGNAVATLSTLGAADISAAEHAALAGIIDQRLRALEAP